MRLQDKVVVVTGGANGIGRALCERFAAEGAHAVIVADVDLPAANELAARINGIAIQTDVSREADIANLVEQVVIRFGRIDLFVSNAGIGGVPGGEEVPNDDWQRIWEVNVLSHIYAARAVVPAMLERGVGYLLNTVRLLTLSPSTQPSPSPNGWRSHTASVGSASRASARRACGQRCWQTPPKKGPAPFYSNTRLNRELWLKP